MTHREAIKEWLGLIELKEVRVIDWGSGSKPVSRYIKYENCKFITIDKNTLIASDRRAPTHYTHDLQRPFDLSDMHEEYVDVAFCIEVLEHTMRPDLVLKNIYNNLKDGGLFYLSMPYDFRVHSDDDYMRLTENGLRAWFDEVGFTINSLRYSTGTEGFIIEATK